MNYIPPERIGFRSLGVSELDVVTRVTHTALESYDLKIQNVELIAAHTNLIFKVLATDGNLFALRIRTGPLVDFLTEFIWLNAVRNETSIKTVTPKLNFHGEFVTSVKLEDKPEIYHCSLFLWLPGDALANNLTPEHYFNLGGISSDLHQFSANWIAPRNLNPLVWDRVLYYPNTKYVIGSLRYLKYIDLELKYAAEKITRLANQELVKLAKSRSRFYIHGNLEMWNVIVDDDSNLNILDFEDVMLGLPVQDISITLHYGRDRTDYRLLRQAFHEGYRAKNVCRFPDDKSIEILSAARTIMLLNHALLTLEDPLDFVLRVRNRIIRTLEYLTNDTHFAHTFPD